jgi:hypothetical protein
MELEQPTGDAIIEPVREPLGNTSRGSDFGFFILPFFAIP